MDAKTDRGGAPGEAKVIRVMARVFNWSAAFILFILMVWTFVDVIAREAFNHPLEDTTDLTRLLLAAMVYAVLPIVSRYERHVSVDLLDRFMPQWLERPRQIAINLAAAVIMGVMAWQIWLIAIDKLDIGEKTEFSALGSPIARSWLRESGVQSLLVCGIETHVCVNQTVHNLLAADYQVHIATDALGSRKSADHQAGLEKMIHAGALPTTTEMAAFELLGDAHHAKFREIQSLFK